jgi:hypothetical protein
MVDVGSFHDFDFLCGQPIKVIDQGVNLAVEVVAAMISTPHPFPMTRSRPLARPVAGLRLLRIPFVASQATQVPGRGGEEENRGMLEFLVGPEICHKPPYPRECHVKPNHVASF